MRVLGPNKGVHRGRDAIDRIAGIIKATHPDYQYQPIGAPEELGDAARCRWVSGTPGKAPAYAGTDFVIARSPPSISSLTRSLDEAVVWPSSLLGRADEIID